MIFDGEEAEGANSITLHRLMAKASRIDIEPPLCENCKHSPCLDGELLTKDNFVIKDKLKLGLPWQDNHRCTREAVGLLGGKQVLR
jgi:hypothetical protein